MRTRCGRPGPGWRRRFAAVIGVVLVATPVSGCSMLSKDPSPTRTAPPTQSELDEIVLSATDLPSGWKGRYEVDDEADDVEMSGFARCMGVRYPGGESTVVAEAASAEFTKHSARITSSAASYGAQREIDALLTLLRHRRFAPCMERLFRDEFVPSLPPDVRVEALSFTRTKPWTGRPDNVVAFASKIKLVGPKGPVTLYMDFVFIGGPYTESDVFTSNLNKPFPASVLHEAVGAIATRTDPARNADT